MPRDHDLEGPVDHDSTNRLDWNDDVGDTDGL